MTDPAVPVAAKLAELRGHAESLAKAKAAYKPSGELLPSGPAGEWVIACIEAAYDVPRLLAAVEAALAVHVPAEQIVYRACPAHDITRTMRRPRRYQEMRDCPDCAKMPNLVCDHCDCPNDDWPCPTYKAITTPLLGGTDE